MTTPRRSSPPLAPPNNAAGTPDDHELHPDPDPAEAREPHTHHTRRPDAGMTLGALLSQGSRQLPEALRKLDPRHMWRSPVMFLVLLGSVATTVAAIADPSIFTISIAVWLWLTVVFGNLAEAVAEGRGKAQAASLRATRTDTVARLLADDGSESEVAGDPAQGRATASSSRPAR